jgi:hypothetical protein
MENSRLRKPEVYIAGLALLICLGFAAYTQHVWEDYWITYRASHNLATGHGLVYTPGERLHTFTSPLGALLPAAFSWLTGNQHDLAALWLFRIASSAALGGALILLYLSLKTLPLQRASLWLALGLIALDNKVVDFSINGMETGLLLLFAALAIHGLLVEGPRQMLRIGAGWAGMMWTRPDSCVYIAALGLGSLLFLSRQKDGPGFPANAKRLLVGLLVCVALYLPWVLWAWWYYGTPVPHTIVAKAAAQPPLKPAVVVISLIKFPWRVMMANYTSIRATFLPSYAAYGGWPTAYEIVASTLGSLAALVWLLPGVRPQTRLFSLVFFLGTFYLTAVLRYFAPWYLPLVALFGYLTLGLVFDEALCLTPRFGWNRGWLARLPRVLRVGAAGLIAGQLIVTVCSAREMREQQTFIEDGLRRPIGLWLREHARTPHDSVMLEPLGYIGYYSGLKMLDYPGLASKEMVEARKRLGPGGQNRIYQELKPDWLVLRPREAKYGTFVDVNGLREDYELAQVFDASDKIQGVGWLPGRGYLQLDQTFLVFHRKADLSVSLNN